MLPDIYVLEYFWIISLTLGVQETSIVDYLWQQVGSILAKYWVHVVLLQHQDVYLGHLASKTFYDGLLD